MEEQEFLTFAQASERFAVPVQTMRYWRSIGKMTKYRRKNDPYHTILLDVAELKPLVEHWFALRAHVHEGEVLVDG